MQAAPIVAGHAVFSDVDLYGLLHDTACLDGVIDRLRACNKVNYCVSSLLFASIR